MTAKYQELTFKDDHRGLWPLYHGFNIWILSYLDLKAMKIIQGTFLSITRHFDITLTISFSLGRVEKRIFHGVSNNAVRVRNNCDKLRTFLC